MTQVPVNNACKSFFWLIWFRAGVSSRMLNVAMTIKIRFKSQNWNDNFPNCCKHPSTVDRRASAYFSFILDEIFPLKKLYNHDRGFTVIGDRSQADMKLLYVDFITLTTQQAHNGMWRTCFIVKCLTVSTSFITLPGDYSYPHVEYIELIINICVVMKDRARCSQRLRLLQPLVTLFRFNEGIDRWGNYFLSHRFHGGASRGDDGDHFC